MTSLNKLIKETEIALNNYEWTLKDREFLPARIKELEAELIQAEQEEEAVQLEGSPTRLGLGAESQPPERINHLYHRAIREY
jgi:hypothetical protein